MATKHRVLIVDDDPALVRLLVWRCEDLGLETETAADGLAALMAGTRNPPDLFILDLKMPGADGLSLCEKIAADEQMKAVPVIVLTGSSDMELVHRCETLGVLYCHKGLEVWRNLKPIICDTLNIAREIEKPERPRLKPRKVPASGISAPKILVIDDDPDITKAMSIRLGALGIDVIQAADAEHAMHLAHDESPDLIITDFHMPGMSGERLLRDLKKYPDTKEIPVIILTGDTVDGQTNYALRREFLGRLGAAAYFGKPLDFDALLKELTGLISIPERPAAIAHGSERTI